MSGTPMVQIAELWQRESKAGRTLWIDDSAAAVRDLAGARP